MKKLFLLYIPIIMLVSFNSHGEDIIASPGQGVVSEIALSGTSTISVGANGNWVCSQPYTAGVTSNTGEPFSASDFGTTSDGVFGLKYLPWPDSDTVVTLDGTTTTTRTGVSGTGYVAPNTKFNWVNGIPSGVGSAYTSCLSTYPWNLTPMPSTTNRGNGSTTVNLTEKVHVGPNAVRNNTYTPSTTSLSYYVRDSTRITSAVLPTIMIADPLECTISPPDTITFGEINITSASNGQVLAYSGIKNLQVNCLYNGANSRPATIQVTGNVGRYTDTLRMYWDDSSVSTDTPAEIRGFIGAPLPSAGECNGKNNGYTNYITFQASANQQISIGNLSTGTNIIPYSFSLCSNGIQADGDANAQAVINLTWN